MENRVSCQQSCDAGPGYYIHHRFAYGRPGKCRAISLKDLRAHSSDPLSPLFNRYLTELAQVRNQQRTVTDPDNLRLSVPSRSRLKWYDCFNQLQINNAVQPFYYPVEPDFADLTMWYRFDYAGNKMHDYSCFDNHAFVVGNPRLVEGLSYGQYGGNIAMQLDGFNDYYYVPEGLKKAGRITSLSNGFSICCVIQPLDLVSGVMNQIGNPNGFLFFKCDDVGTNFGYSAQILGDGKIMFASKNNNGTPTKKESTTQILGALTQDTDYRQEDYNILDYIAGPPEYQAIPNFFIIWFVSTSANPPVVTIYVNGSAITTTTSSVDSHLGTSDYAPNTDTIIGASKLGLTNFAPVIFQDYRFMKRQVTAQEVLNHWNNKISISNIALGQVFSAGAVVFGADPPVAIFTDGINDWIDCGNDATLWSQALTKFSFSVWVYPLSVPATGADRDIMRHGATGQGRFRIDIPVGTSDARFRIRNNADSAEITATSSGTMVANQWQNLIGTYDNSLGSANVKIFRNTVQGGSTGNHTETKNLSAPFYIGGGVTSINAYFKDFRWWSTIALDSTQRTNVFNNSPSAPTPNYWLPLNNAKYLQPLDSISGTKYATLVGGADWKFVV